MLLIYRPLASVGKTLIGRHAKVSAIGGGFGPALIEFWRHLMADEITNYYEKLEIGALTYTLFLLNAEIDNGDKWRGISFEDVYSHLEAGDLIPFLDERLQLEMAFILGPGKEQGELLLAGLRHISEYTRDRESQKLGLEKSGVCLVISWVLSLIQNGLWDFSDRWLTDHRNLYVHGTPIYYNPSDPKSEE